MTSPRRVWPQCSRPVVWPGAQLPRQPRTADNSPARRHQRGRGVPRQASLELRKSRAQRLAQQGPDHATVAVDLVPHHHILAEDQRRESRLSDLRECLSGLGRIDAIQANTILLSVGSQHRNRVAVRNGHPRARGVQPQKAAQTQTNKTAIAATRRPTVTAPVLFLPSAGR